MEKKSSCQFCGKQIRSSYPSQLKYNLEAHELSCKLNPHKTPTLRETKQALNDAVKFRLLQLKDKKYSYHPDFKDSAVGAKGKTALEQLLNVLYKHSYFAEPRTEREIEIICNLMLLRKDNTLHNSAEAGAKAQSGK